MNNYSSIKEYLNKVKQLSDQLKAKKLELPKQVIIAWVLNNLTESYDGFVAMVCRGKGRVLYVVEGKDALFYERCVGSPDLIAKVGLPSPFYIIG